ncbi:hypothetical protein AAV33_06840 [Corynebacterium otitidis]|nr:hypothetical protein AAV33_06840 [Corynebacterium otitidis]
MPVLLIDDDLEPRLPARLLAAGPWRLAPEADVPKPLVELLEEALRAGRGAQREGGGEAATLPATTDPRRAERLAGGGEVVDCRRPVDRAVAVMAEARRRGEWERAQTHESLLAYLDEEAGEFADAVRAWDGGDDAELKGELADVFLQVLFHAAIAAERGSFTLGDVADSFTEKMRSRAPYLFDGSSGIIDAESQEKLWAAGKNAAQRRIPRL